LQDYVEEATNYSPDFAGEEQLQAIAQYCQAPSVPRFDMGESVLISIFGFGRNRELLEIVLDVLSERMKCAWPWNIKVSRAK
jgi:hypothetical protein